MSSPEFNPNRLRNLRSDYRNEADIFDLTTWDEAYRDVGAVVKTAETRITVPEETELTERQAALTETLLPLLSETSANYKEAIWQLLETQPINAKIAEHIRKHGFDTPEFSLLTSEAAQPYLEATHYPDDEHWYQKLDERELLLRFQLPKPLAHFWRKGSSEQWNQVEVGPRITEWGTLYRETLSLIWELVGRIECETDVQIERLNALGHHDPKSFYYLWIVR